MLSNPLPPSLSELAESRWRDFHARTKAGDVSLPALDPAFLEQLKAVWACSEFVAQSCIRDPSLLAGLVASGDLVSGYTPGGYQERVTGALAQATDDASLGTALRRLRRREMVRIAWRDLTRLATLEETTGDLSHLADAVLDGALARLHDWQSASLGVPTSREGQAQSLVIIAMGKLGARELNFSSDIDLIFAFPEPGKTLGGRRELTSQEYFVRLGQRLINTLNATTAEGIVFRVDMRLRPFGASGPLAMDFDAMEAYYQTHGREWERYALIKARAAAGDKAHGDQLLERLQPFVYRRYLDFGAFEALRDMKSLVSQEVVRKGLEGDVKLGPGGIREVEFIAQAFQLIRGGREPALRDRRLLPVLKHLAALGHLPDEAVEALRNAYRFLRDTEHRLQEIDDRQTQALPQDDLNRARLAYAMGFLGWDDFIDALDAHRGHVQAHFQQVFAVPHEETPSPRAQQDLQRVWLGTVAQDQAATALAKAGYDDGNAALQSLEQLRNTYGVRAMGPDGRRRLDRLMPLLLGAVSKSDRPATALERIVRLVEAIARRSVYLALLVEYPEALSQLVRLCGASPWIASHITRHPLLLDELLDPRALYAPPDRAGLETELAAQLEDLAPGDTEQEMETLRVFHQTNVLRVAAADAANALPLMRVSDHLTDIAEVLVRQALDMVWRDLSRQYGEPACQVAGKDVRPGFIVVAYGKLGGIELGYGSDLDLVFLHGSRGERQHTDGARSIDNGVFFARLAKRFIHLLTAHTPAGVLYEVDARLRPSGASGLLVSSMDAFGAYQRQQAWTWEHQALVRARVVAGERALGEEFDAVRREVLTRQRDPGTLRSEVREMRERMRRSLGSAAAGSFDLKQDTGGIADIEFVVQYGVLLWALQRPEILQYTDNIRLLDGFASAGLLPPADAARLADAYRTYRARVHTLALQERMAVVPDTEFRDLRDGVTAIWQQLLGE